MSNITTDFITATKKIHADIRAVLLALHLIRDDVKLIREKSDAQAASSQKDSSREIPTDNTLNREPRTLETGHPERQQDTSDNEGENFIKRLCRRWRASLMKPKFQIAVATLIAIVIYTREVNKSNKVAENTLSWTKEQFETDQRPYIAMIRADMMNKPEAGQAVNFRMTLQNVGKTAALNSWNQQTWKIARELTVRQIVGPDRVESGIVLLPATPIFIDVTTDPLTEAQMSLLTRSKLCLYAFGYISYKDIFGTTRETSFCSFYSATVPWSQERPGVSFCPHANCIIWDGAEGSKEEEKIYTSKCP